MIDELVRRGVAKADARKVTTNPVAETLPMRSVQKWLGLDMDDPRWSFLTVFGSTGAGKTFANSWMAWQIVERQMYLDPLSFQFQADLIVNSSVKMWFAPALINMLMGCRFENGERQEECRRHAYYATNVPMLIITDLGREAIDGKGYALNSLFTLLDARYGAELRTSIDSNLGMDDLSGRYQPALMDRLSGHGVFVDCTEEPSQRGKT